VVILAVLVLDRNGAYYPRVATPWRRWIQHHLLNNQTQRICLRLANIDDINVFDIR